MANNNPPQPIILNEHEDLSPGPLHRIESPTNLVETWCKRCNATVQHYGSWRAWRWFIWHRLFECVDKGERFVFDPETNEYKHETIN